MKKMVNLTKKTAIANLVAKDSKVTVKNTVKEIEKELSREVLYPSTMGDFDGLNTARTNAVLWLSELGTVKRYKDGLCAKQGRKKICEVYLVTADNRVHVYADKELIGNWSKKYRGFLTETDKWSRFEFLYSEWLRFTDNELYGFELS